MSASRVNGIRFNGLHSYYDFGMWLAERPSYGSPAPKTSMVEIPGADGKLDLSEANAGEIKFANRTLTFSFAKMVNANNQDAFCSLIMGSLHGKFVQQIIPDEAPDWIYSGRAKVAFSKVTSWKLRIVVTVDAAPYALKSQMTVVNLLTGEPDLFDVEIPGTDVSANPYNTDLRYGSKSFPTCNLSALAPSPPQLLLEWPQTALVKPSNRFIQIADGNGGVYTSGVIPSGAIATGGPIRFAFSDFVDAGVDLTKIYRGVVIGIGGASFHIERYAYHHKVWNERKTAIPYFSLDAGGNGATIILNGRSYSLQDGDTENREIVLSSGWNEIYVPYSSSLVTFTMRYQEGKL